MSTFREFRGGGDGRASPKQLEEQRVHVRRQRARKAGLASAAKRRKLCDPQRRREHQRELALNFAVRLVSRDEFDRLDFARRVRLGIEPNDRGTETLWQRYRCCVRTFKVKGQGFLTTNGQGARALHHAGRPRCARTVRRADAALTEMGLLRRFHDRRGGSMEGRRDRLRVQFAPAFVPLPSAAPTTATQCRSCCASHDKDCAADGRRHDRAAQPTGSGPPYGGQPSPAAPAAPANGGSEEEERDALGAGNTEEGESVLTDDEERMRRARETVSRVLGPLRGDRR